MMNYTFTNKKNFLVVGRGAVAIYLALISEGVQGKKVLLPANICYAAVFPVLLSNNIPVFCDVDKFNGNVTLSNVKNAWEEDIVAAVIPHMYGNPVVDISKIVDFAHSKGAFVIEDCASSLGAQIDKQYAGDFGDYSVFSFGHSKTIDISNGGILATNRNLEKARDFYSKLKSYSDDIANDCDFFSKIYRIIRNNSNQGWSSYIYESLAKKADEMFLYKVDKNFEQKIEEAVVDFEKVVSKRRTQVDLYKKSIKFNEDVKEYVFEKNASPWRFNVLVEPTIRKQLISYLLKNNIPVSDWYPNVTDIFFSTKNFDGVNFMENRILNFPLMINEEQIKHICETFNRFFEG